jgi:glycosyltransferase involved in cell wall biosynthesis
MMLADRKVPFVTTLHGTDITLVGNDRSYLPITRFGIEQSDAVTAVSKYLLRRTVEEFQIHRPIAVVPNFVDCNVYNRTADPPMRGRFAESDEAILIQISNFRPLKRIEDVIAIFARFSSIAAQSANGGDGPERPKAEWCCYAWNIRPRSFSGKAKRYGSAPFHDGCHVVSK